MDIDIDYVHSTLIDLSISQGHSKLRTVTKEII